MPISDGIVSVPLLFRTAHGEAHSHTGARSAFELSHTADTTHKSRVVYPVSLSVTRSSEHLKVRVAQGFLSDVPFLRLALRRDNSERKISCDGNNVAGRAVDFAFNENGNGCFGGFSGTVFTREGFAGEDGQTGEMASVFTRDVLKRTHVADERNSGRRTGFVEESHDVSPKEKIKTGIHHPFGETYPREGLKKLKTACYCLECLAR